MDSALYFPYATPTDRVLLKQALLLWDELEFIVPWEGFAPETHERDIIEAIGTIGRAVQPNDRVKDRTRARIQSLLRSKLEDGGSGLPEKYLLQPDEGGANIYADKFDQETWRMLNEEYRLVDGNLRRHKDDERWLDYKVSRPLALAIMTILAEEIAGKTARLVTDQQTSSESQAAITTRELGGDFKSFEPEHELCVVQLLAPAVPVAGMSLQGLVKLRNAESAFLKSLRENYRVAVNEYIDSVTAPDSARDDVRRIVERYEGRMKGHLTELERMLGRQNLIQGLGVGEAVGVSVGAGVFAGIASLVTMGVAPITALAVAAGTALGTAAVNKLFRLAGSIPQSREKREELMRKNPAAWLYHVEQQTGAVTFAR